MIIKNDETHLQCVLSNAVKEEKITGTEAAQILVGAMRDGYFKKDGQVKKAKYNWFINLLKEYPWNPVRPASYKYKIGEAVHVDEGLEEVIVVIHDRFKKGDVVTPEQIKQLSKPRTLKENWYRVGLFNPPPMLDGLNYLVPESKIIGIVSEKELRNKLK